MQFSPLNILPFLALVMLSESNEIIAQATKGQTFRTHTFTLSAVKKAEPIPDSVIKIAFLGNEPFLNMNKESRSAFDFLKLNKRFYPVYVTFDELHKNPGLLHSYKVAWFHRQDTSHFTPSETDRTVLKGIKDFLYNGGNLLLTLDAFHYLNTLGIEPVKPADSLKPSTDEGYGRKLGFHAFLNHPVFDGMFGGAYIMMPVNDTAFRVTGYFGNSVPENGKVIGVDWDYIFLREDSKLMLEYHVGKGKVIAVGGYTCYSVPNMNRNHLELFTTNLFRYLCATDSSSVVHYWNNLPATVYTLAPKPQSSDTSFASIPGSVKWEIPVDPLAIRNRYASDNFWDVAGEQMLTMGIEKGGIEEIWAHPFMAFRDYEAGLRFEYHDTIYWLNDERPEVEAHPSCFIRNYKFPRAYLQEIITNDPEHPNGVIHYEYHGLYPAELVIKVKSNLRLMWPYSEKALGSIAYHFDHNYKAIFVQDQSGKYAAMIGANRSPDTALTGQFSGFRYDKIRKTFNGTPDSNIMVSGLLTYHLTMVDQLDMVFAATSEGRKTTRQYFDTAIRNPLAIAERSRIHNDSLLARSLMIQGPDPDFNKGYCWALISTDRFFVNTPGMGRSLVAGYSTTRTGWNGGHKVNGRPGYGWYFGRDGEWSGFALLDYGDFQKVRSELEFYAKFQDLSGKIFHEATTSGVIHYDAADATPLYIVLAGKYFRHTQDTAFLRANWPFIKKAVDFCFSTDRDHDHLIENTNVGHGWVEGGELYGSHATLYLQGCWAAALKETANMAAALKDPEAESYELESGIVKGLINTKFWNPSKKYYSYGMNKDGTFRSEATVLPAIPLYFKLGDQEKAKPVLEQLASNAFSTNWGTRIIREDSPFFKPTGYHYGSVWPLFTGWTALAEYAYGNYQQGFSHIMNNLDIYKYWGKGFIEEVMNGASFEPSGVCPHQCWSETMVLQPAIEGMLGLVVNDGENKVVLSPHFPAGWDSASVRNIRSGNSTFDLSMKRTDKSYYYTFTPHGNQPVIVEFSPTYPSGTIFNQITRDGNETQFTSFNNQKSTSLLVDLKLTGNTVLQVEYNAGIEVLPAVTDPSPGSQPEGLRILGSRLSGYKYYIRVENERKTLSTIDVYVHNQEIEKIENGTLMGSNGDIFHINVAFDPGPSKYQVKTVIIYLKQGSATGRIISIPEKENKEYREKKKEYKEKKANSPKCPRWY
jgi:glycogen debranching enzyme